MNERGNFPRAKGQDAARFPAGVCTGAKGYERGAPALHSLARALETFVPLQTNAHGNLVEKAWSHIVARYRPGLGCWNLARVVRARCRVQFHYQQMQEFRKEAEVHKLAAQDCESFDDESTRAIARQFRAQAEMEIVRAEYHSQLSRQYRSIASMPWLIILPLRDPPPPSVKHTGTLRAGRLSLKNSAAADPSQLP